MPADPEFTDVFISHSSSDKEYAVATIDFLRACFEFQDYEITCTSAPLHGLVGGVNFERDVQLSISKCKVFVALLSASSLASVFCVMEMGAAWGRRKTFKPILLPGLPAADVPRPLSSMHLLNWGEPASWLQLADDIHEKTGTKKRRPRSWHEMAAAVAHRRKAQLVSSPNLQSPESGETVLSG
ncbi:TIR domain protein [compost metagenome]